MHIKARSLFGLYRYCLHVALRKREFGSFNGMMRHCREIQLRIFVTDKSQCRCSSEYIVLYTKTIFCLVASRGWQENWDASVWAKIG